jgi:regulator of CtrA degradation
MSAEREGTPVKQEQSSGLAATRFFSGTYDEAITLATRTRDYLIGAGASAQRRLDTATRITYSLESSRIVSRIAYMMVWLLYQRAVHAGEISAKSAALASPELRGIGFCNESWGRDPTRLPSDLIALWEESLRLYRRVSRLDEMVRRDVPRPAQMAQAPMSL